jgi:hypothetical protein
MRFYAKFACKSFRIRFYEKHRGVGVPYCFLCESPRSRCLCVILCPFLGINGQSYCGSVKILTNCL